MNTTELKYEPMTGTKGLEMAQDGDYIYIRFKLGQNFGQSKSGQSYIVATTSGNTKIPGTKTMLGLNAYRTTPDE
jgi:hypothetical protein